MAQEAFELEFERKRAVLPVITCTAEGITLDNEGDAWPLGVALKLEPLTPVTKFRFETIQRNNNWIGRHVFKLKISQAGTRLRFEGIRPGQLPEGSYRLNVFISGYRFHPPVHEFEIPKDGTAIVRIVERADSRSVSLNGGVATFDDDVRRVVEASTLDGRPLTQWIEDRTRRDSRKACLLNLLAKLRTPIAGNQPLARQVEEVLFADVDRIYVKLQPGFGQLLAQPGSGFRQDPGPIHETHGRLRRRIPKGDAHQLFSFREQTAQLSMQIVVAATSDSKAPQYADVDLDLGNPFVSPAGFFIHVGELIDPAKTDHLSLCGALSDSACKDFLYYAIAEAVA